MLAPTQIAVFMLVAMLVWYAWEQNVKRFKCWYCGKYKGHDEKCPCKPLGWNGKNG